MAPCFDFGFIVQIIPIESLTSSEAPVHNASARDGLATSGTPLGQPRLPDWLKVKVGKARQTQHTNELLQSLDIVTVCQEARCPNVGECWSNSTATFMICGDSCTRACAFCNVKTARP